jgi:hypothetical protein
MANLQKLIDLDGLSYFLGQIKAKFVRSVNGAKPDSKGNVNIANMEGATSNAAGKAGLVPIPAAGKQDMALCGDATFKVLPIAGGGTGQTTAAGVRNILGLGNTDGALPIANGGTGADNANTALSNLGILGAIVNASVSGKTITFTKKDNTKFSIDTQDTNNGIVAALLAQNGYVKFANGLILQWGACERGTLEISFLLTMSNTNYNINKQLTQYYDGVSYSRETCVYDLDVSGCKTYGTTSSFRWLVIGW